MSFFETFGEHAYRYARTGAATVDPAESDAAPLTRASHLSRLEHLLQALAWLVLAVALAARLAPLLDIEGRIFWQFMTEDGYLMQTVARNMALGLGMSTAEGTIPTNGVQPLATYLFAGLHWMAGGDRAAAITLVMLFSALVSVAGAYCLYRLARALLDGMRYSETLALVISAVWFAGPLTVAHSMNGLETGLYVLAMLVALLYYVSRFQNEDARPRWLESVGLGALLGLAFLARNDAVFFIAALLAAHLFVGSYERSRWLARLGESLLAGLVSVVIGLPWLINNYLLFGSVVPISGLSQSFWSALGENLKWIPANLIEVSFPFVPIPRSLETGLPVMIAGIGIVVLMLAAFWFLLGRRSTMTQRVTVLTIGFSAAITLYYGLFFGAAHFIPRYLSILSPLLWLMSAVVIFYGASALLRKPPHFQAVAGLAMFAILIEITAFLMLSYRNGTTHMHRQVVDWVSANVEPQRWVAAVQTGTLGFFHDRTLNLDGKVNPAALRELLRQGNVFDYVIASPADYIVDWAGIGGWLDHPQADVLRDTFSLELVDHELNLSVMKRRQQTTIN